MLKSSFPQHRLPAIPEGQGALLLAILHQLERSERLSAAALRDAQFEQLDRVLCFAAQQVPAYRKSLRRLGLSRGRGRGLDAGAWLDFPVMDRSSLQADGHGLVAESPPPGHQQAAPVKTSGSTGTPVTVVSTEVTRLLWQALTLRDHYWHQTDFSGRLAAIRICGDKAPAPYPDGRELPDWGAPVSLLHETGAASLLSIHTPVSRQLEWLQRQGAHRLLTFPSNAAALARECVERGVDLRQMTSVRLLSEVLDDETRMLIADTWQATVTQGYSAQEVGHIALQCPKHTHLHVMGELLYVEVLDDDGQPCGPGEEGRVVISTLHNFAMPLLRYDIGDRAVVGEPCDCGRGLPVLTRILGRVRNMLITPQGERHWPNLAAPFYRAIAPVIQHQIVQLTRDRLEARLIVERPLTPQEEAQLRDKIVERIGHPVEVKFAYPAALERSTSGKYEEFVCLAS